MEKEVPSDVPVSLTPMIVYGIRKEVVGNVHCSFNDEIIYPVEEVLVFHDIKTHKQRFMRFPENTFPTMVAINTTRRLIAVVELNTLTTAASGFETNISVYDTVNLKKRRNFKMPNEELQIEKITFIKNTSGILVLTKHPDPILFLMCFDEDGTILETSIELPSLRNTVTCIEVNPYDVNWVALCGDGIVKVLLKNETEYSTAISLRLPFSVVSMAWLSLYIILLGLKRGKLLLVENGEIKYKFNATEVDTIDLEKDQEAEFEARRKSVGLYSADVNCIVAQPNFFAYSVGNKVYLFRKVAKYIFERTKIITLNTTVFAENLYNIKHLSIHAEQECIVVTANHCQIYECNLNAIEAAESQYLKFKPFGPLLHDDEVIDISVCAWKTIIMTASKDQCIRIWNYETKKIELIKRFQVDINLAELNITGQFAAVAFIDQLRIMQIFVDDLHIIKTYNFTSCHSVKYSNLGHLMAAGYGNLISITSVYNLDIIKTLKGHNGNVLSVAWSRDDKYLISGGAAGAIYQWDVETGQRVQEIVHKNSTYHTICCSGNPLSIYSLTESGYLKELKDSDVLMQIKAPHGTVFTSLALSRSDQMMFAATETGNLYNVKLPFVKTKSDIFRNFRFFDRTITKIVFSYDDTLLITGSKAGTLVIWVLQNIEGRTVPHSTGLLQGNEVLVSRKYLKEMNDQIANLEVRIVQQATEFEYQKSQKEIFGNRNLIGAKVAYRKGFEMLKTRNAILVQKQTEDLNEVAFKIDRLTKDQLNQVIGFSKTYKEGMLASYDAHSNFNKIIDFTINDYEERLRKSASNFQDTIEAMEIKFNDSLGKREDLIRGLLQEIQEKKIKYMEYIQWAELADQRNAMSRLVEHENIKKIKQQVEIMWRGEAGVIKRKSDSISKEADALIEEVLALNEDLKNFQRQTIHSLNRKREELSNYVADCEHAISVKENRIQEILRMNQQLEKYKKVLSHAIYDLKIKIEPREHEINDIRNRIAEREIKLDSLNKQHRVIKVELDKFEIKLGKATDELKKQRHLSVTGRQTFHNLCTELYHITKHMDNPDKLRAGLWEIIEKYASDKELRKRLEQDFKVKQEFKRQKAVIEKSIEIYKVKIREKLSTSKKLIQLRENMRLLKECDEVRQIIYKNTQERDILLRGLTLYKKQSPFSKIKLLLTLELIQRCRVRFEIEEEDLMEQRGALLLENENLHREIDMSKTITQ